MIPMLIIYILKQSTFGKSIIKKFNAFKRIFGRGICFVFIFFVTNAGASNLNRLPKTITYRIVKNNKSVGSITIKREKLGNSIAYTLSSKIKAKFIVEFDIEAEEKSIYKEGALVYSSIFRKLNDKVKLNQSLSLVEGQYVLKSLDATEALSLNVIYRNLITLFFNEPINVKKIYSDKFKKMISIIPLGNGKYKINFSHNTSNVYHYENGKCTMIEAKGPFYKVKLVPEIL